MHEAKDKELIHMKFCQWILNIKKSINFSGLYSELGLVPFLVQREFNMNKYWVKLINSTDALLPNKVYEMLREDADSGNSYNGTN